MEKSATQGTVLVTGGCGFIGTWVLKQVQALGARTVVLDSGEPPARWGRVLGAGAGSVKLIRGSLLERELLRRVFEEQGVTHVIHLAALLTPACQSDPWQGCSVNVLGTVGLFEEIRRAGERVQGVSYASSVAVFGDEPDHANAGSEAGLPMTFYGVFKKSVELIADQYQRHFGVRSLGIRPQVAYGPEREVGLTAGPSMAARAAAAGINYHIGYTGRVGYDYVEDVAQAFVRGAFETPANGGVADLAGPMADVGEVIEAIESVSRGTGSKITASGPVIPAHAPSRPRYISEYYPDWQTIGLVAGMRRTVEFYRGPGDQSGV